MASDTTDVHVVIARVSLEDGHAPVEQVAYITMDPVLAEEYIVRKLQQQHEMEKLSRIPFPRSDFYRVVAQLGKVYPDGLHVLPPAPTMFASPQLPDDLFAQLSLNSSENPEVFVDMSYDKTDRDVVYRISDSLPPTKLGKYMKVTALGRDYAFPDGEGLVNENNAPVE